MCIAYAACAVEDDYRQRVQLGKQEATMHANASLEIKLSHTKLMLARRPKGREYPMEQICASLGQAIAMSPNGAQDTIEGMHTGSDHIKRNEAAGGR